MRRACLATRPHGRIPSLSAGSGSDQRRVGTALASLACLLTASCGHSRTTTAAVVTHPTALPAVPSSPPDPTPPSAAASAIAAAVAAYRSYWDDAVYANARAGYWNDTTRASLGTGGSLYTLFAQHAAGSAFEQQRVAVYRADRNGEFTEGDLKLHPLVLDASPTTRPTEVRLTDCVDATDWLVHVRSDGKLKNGRPGRKYQFEAKVLGNVSGWHVSDASTPPNATC